MEGQPVRRVVPRSLELATARGELAASTQTVLGLADGVPTGWHVRPRWPQPRLGSLTPSSFLPLIVAPVVARRVDQVVLELAVSAAGRSDEVVTVAITTASATDPDLPRIVAGTVDRHGRPHGGLRLAIHASAIRRGGAQLQRVAERLDGLGVRLVVTGLGTESLSWRDLAGLPLAALEVGAGTVRDHRRGSSRAVLRAVAATGAAWDVDVGAAGVDDDAALEAVLAAGCTHARGDAVTRMASVPRSGRRPVVAVARHEAVLVDGEGGLEPRQ